MKIVRKCMLFAVAGIVGVTLLLTCPSNENVDAASEYQEFVDSYCELQTPEANDDYVSVIVNYEDASEMVSEADIKDKLSISVSYGENVYETSYVKDEDDNGFSYFYTTKETMPYLASGEPVTVSIVMEDADRTITQTVAAANTNSAFSVKSITPTVSPSKKDYTYTGSTIKPSAKVMYNGGTILASSYSLSWSNNKNVGKAKLTVTLQKDYKGSKTVTYNINPKGTTQKTPKAAKKAFTAYWSKVSTKMSKSRISGYQVMYSTDSGFKTGNKTVSVSGYSTTSKKISKLKAKKKYYVKVRTYMKTSSGTMYSSWSKVKTVTTK